MSLDRNHYMSIGIFGLLFLILYFGCDTTPKKNKTKEKSVVDIKVPTELKTWMSTAENGLSGEIKEKFESLDKTLRDSSNDSDRSQANKSLSSFWYSQNEPLIAGYYAEKVADIDQTEEAFSIMGTTYALATRSFSEESKKNFAVERSRAAFNKAMDMNPDNLDHQINLALSYVDVMDKENPMKGILMLRQLSEDHPENPSVLFQLGRLSLGTNQLEKAVSRLTKVVELVPQHPQAHCLLAETYQKLNQLDKARTSQLLCDKTKN